MLLKTSRNSPFLASCHSLYFAKSILFYPLLASYNFFYFAKCHLFIVLLASYKNIFMDDIVGREVEKQLLSQIENSGEAELVAVYGRRRVGKTYLIRTYFQRQMAFELSGVHSATREQQLENFSAALSKASGSLPLATPVSWFSAFAMLQTHLAPIVKKKRTVIFIDEFPWLSTPRSGFMQAFENFWNMWASRQPNLVVIICGSAAAWMIQKVINNRGGLHNRLTHRIRLQPFTLSETAAFFAARKINLDQYQVLQLYMAMGGIPQYLKEVKTGESAMQAIDRACFTKDGLLYDEFKNLFHSLFDNPAYHIDVVRALAKKGIGMTRGEIITACKLTSGGGTTQVLDELTESGFITPYIPFGKKAKDSVYKLADEYSNFYIKFIEGSRQAGAGSWLKFSAGQSWKSWSGSAFESICMKHEVQIKRALGIESVHTETSAWRHHPKENEQGVQIDMLIDRQDRCINICEMKFSIGEFELTKGYAAELQHKISTFRDHTKTRKTLFLTMITTHGVKNKAQYAGLVQSEVTMAALFK